MAIFDHAHPKIIESTVSFPEFVPAWKNWFYSICSFLSPVTRLATPIFDHAHPKNFWSAFNFCDHVSTCKKSVYSICKVFWCSQFQSSITRLATPIFEHAHPKNFQPPFNLCEIVPGCKRSVSFINSFLRYSQFPSLETRLATLTQIHIIFVNLYQHATNETVSSICFGEMLDLKIPQSDWLRALWPISQK